jgi:biopolymer transport protein TolR
MGGSSAQSEEIPEPNLTALLDLVLQMVMFFMVVANFVSEQLNAEIQLPTATTTLPVDKEETAIILLNIEGNEVKDGVKTKYGRLILPPKYGMEVLDTQGKIETAMRDIYKRENNPKNLTVVIRADYSANFEQVYRVMKVAKEVGFVNVQLRAKIPQQ